MDWEIIPGAAPPEWSVQFHLAETIKAVPWNPSKAVREYAESAAADLDRESFHESEPRQWVVNSSPKSLAAATLYAGHVRAAGWDPEQSRVTQPRLCEATGVSEMSIRDHYKRIIRFHEPDADLPHDLEP